jgi:signal transduction histidine kinase
MPATANQILPIFFESVIGFQIVYISLQWLYIRRAEYLYYIGYMLVMGLYLYVLYMPFSSENHHPVVLDKTLPMLGYLLYYRFARYFADMHSILPELNLWMKRLEYFLGIYILFELFIKIFEFNPTISEYAFLTVSGLLFILSFVFIYIFLQAKMRLMYFLIAGAIILNVGSFTTMVLHQMMASGQFDSFDPFWPFTIATVLDLMAFTTGLAYKARLTVRENLKIQIEYNKELNQNLALNQQIYTIKEALAQRLHSDLITALSNINIFSGLAKREITSGDTNKTLQHLNKISQTGTNEIQRINDLVWCINPENNTVAQLKNKLISIWGETETLTAITIKTDENCLFINYDITFLTAFIRFMRSIREHNSNMAPNLFLSCGEKGIRIDIKLKTDENQGFFEELLGPYLHLFEREKEGLAILKITTIRD